jgi:ubiquinone/menaquinone biosynthesis C-methylase UbiE
LLGFIGRGGGKALEVGCGEGRISRVLKECGYHVTATDPLEQFIAAAEQARSADDYKVATAANLPFEDGSFDLVVAYNVLMDIEDVPAALREIGRVLRPSGTLIISIVHPFADRGRFAGPEPDAPLSSKNPISAGNVSRALKNATDLRCTSLAGHNLSKITWLRWRELDWRSYRFGSPRRTSATQMHGVIWNIGAGFRSFSG